MKSIYKGLLTGAFAVMTSTAIAGNVSPDDVKIDEGEVAGSLTGSTGDATKGREVFANRKLGNCLAKIGRAHV